MIPAPISVPNTPPVPPDVLVPPMTVLAMALGFFLPGRGLAAAGWAAR